MRRVILLVLPVFAACASVPETPYRGAALQGAGTALRDAGQVRGTVPTDCRSAESIPVATDSVAHATFAGRCALDAQSWSRASAFYARLEALGDPAESARGLGLVSVFNGDPTEAEAHLLRAIEAGSGWTAWNALGFVRDARSDWAGATEAYHRAAEIAPDEAAPHNNLGMSKMRQHDHAGAARAFSEALRRDPSLDAARLNLRLAQAMLGRYDEAIAGAGEAERASVLNGIGLAAMSRGDVSEARRLFAEALDTSPTFYTAAFENLRRAATAIEE